MLSRQKRPLVILADDDEDDFLMSKEALLKSIPDCDILWAENGEKVFEILQDREIKPSLIVMDLNMPCKDGRETLQEIRSNPVFSALPVIMMTMSTHPTDTKFCYENGANSVIQKPSQFGQLLKVFETISKYWLHTVQLPEPR